MIFLEQKHILSHLGMSRNAVAFRKGERKRDTLQRIQDSWGLPPGLWHWSQPAMSNARVLGSKMVAPWLLNQILRPGHQPSATVVRAAMAVLRSIEHIAIPALGRATCDNPLHIADARGNFIGDVRAGPEHPVVPGERSILTLFPELVARWQTVREQLPDGMELPEDIDSATYLHWLIYCRSVPRSFRLRSRELQHVCMAIARAANDRLAQGFESWVICDYLPSMTGREAVRTMMTRSGRRTKMDSFTVAGALHRCRLAHGSSSTFLHAALDDPNLDRAINRAMTNIFLGKVQQSFGGTTRLAWAWDAGTYGGASYNIGTAWSVDKCIASPMPVQAPFP